MSPSKKEAGLSHATLWLWLTLLAFIAVPLEAGAQTSTAWDWGFNGYGQLGDNSLVDINQPVAAQIPSPDGNHVTRVSGGGWHSLALTQFNGTTTVWAWGDDAFGQLGNNAFTTSLVPVPVNATWVSGGWVPTEIAAGGDHSLALTVSNGGSSVWAWGDDTFGQLGNGTTTINPMPVPVPVLEVSNLFFPSNGTATAVAAGEWHSLALKTLNGTSTVWSWGNNAFGQLGSGTNTDRAYAATVPGLPTNVTAIAAGDRHSLALTGNGLVYAWGWNAYGQLGNGTTTDSNTPLQLTAPTNVVAIAAGAFHSLALDSSGDLWAWGSNEYGQLGDGTWTNSPTPVLVDTTTGLQGPLAIAAGGLHSLAVGTVGSPTSTAVWAWGQNEFGELGNVTNTNSNSPVQVSHSGYQPIINQGIEAGWLHSLAIFQEGPVACTTTTTTRLSATSTTLGVPVTDTATVVNAGSCSTSPTGVVEFYYQCGTTTGPWTLFSTRPLVNGTSTSIGIAPPTAGTCYFYAAYLSDNPDHLDSQSSTNPVPADETLEIAKLPTSITTLLSATIVNRGTNVTDGFTISTSLPDPAATGTWTLESSPNAWSWTPVPGVSGPVAGLPFLATTPPFQLPPGFWYLRITYSGDTNHAGSASGSWSEILIVL